MVYHTSGRTPLSDLQARDASLLKTYPSLRSLKPASSILDLARTSDVVITLLPGGQSTYHIIDESFLRAMKARAVLINVGRGTIVDSDALSKALRENWIWGAGLDVVEGEPNVGANHPLVGLPNCVVLPHIGSATFETRTNMSTLAAKNLVRGVHNEPLVAEVSL